MKSTVERFLYTYEPGRDSRVVTMHTAPLPDDCDLLADQLQQRHERNPFSFIEPSSAVLRVLGRIAMCDIEAERVHIWRGELAAEGVSIRHSWITIDEAVIDMAYPVHSPSFCDSLRAFVLNGYECSEEKQRRQDLDNGINNQMKRQPFHMRVLGEYPQPQIQYIGTAAMDLTRQHLEDIQPSPSREVAA